jgi:hypothetical protein
MFQVQWSIRVVALLWVLPIKLNLSKLLKQLQHARLNPLALAFAPKKQVFSNEIQLKTWEACIPGNRVIHVYQIHIIQIYQPSLSQVEQML